MAGLRKHTWILAVFLALAMTAVAEEPVPLTLPEAAKMTLANNPMHKAALADTKAASAGVREARAPMLPRIMFAENFTAGNDPVFVFGTKLRQQEFTAADFALNSLNRPTPIGNYASRFSGQWNLFDSTQSWKALGPRQVYEFRGRTSNSIAPTRSWCTKPFRRITVCCWHKSRCRWPRTR